MDIENLTASTARRAIGAGHVSARELVEAHLAAIERTSAVNAIVTRDSEGALARADELDRLGPSDTRPLHGLPVVIKDTHDVRGMPTTYGSIRHTDHVPNADALHVARMREAGAVIVGKSNVPEHAAGSHTVNRLFGATRNPYALDRSAGGSSGGAAAALAARQVLLADGSDMGGSLRNPASFCNVVGLRPTPGLVPNAETGNILTPLTTAGPMGRTVDDVAMLLAVIGRPDSRTPIAAPAPVAAQVSAAPLRGLRVAWAPTLGDRVPVEASVVDALEPFARRLELEGAHVSHASPQLDGADDAFLVLRAAEFAAEFGDAQRADPEAFEQRIAWNIVQGRRLTARDVLQAQHHQTTLMRGAAAFFDDFDVLLAPTAQVPPFPIDQEYPSEVDGVTQRHYLDWMRAASMVSMIGTPSLSLPAGWTSDGLPVGIQIITRAGTDATLLSIAKGMESLDRFASRAPDLA